MRLSGAVRLATKRLRLFTSKETILRGNVTCGKDDGKTRSPITNVMRQLSKESGPDAKGQVSLEIATGKDFIPLLDAFVHGFGQQEPIGKLLSVDHEDLYTVASYVIANSVKSGFSMKMVDTETDRIVGFRCTSVHVSDPEHAESLSPLEVNIEKASKPLKKMLTMLAHCRDTHLAYGKEAGWKKWLTHEAIYIDPAYSRNGQKLASKVINLDAIELIRMGIDAETAECTSIRSAQVLSQSGFTALSTVPDSVYRQLRAPPGIVITPMVKDLKAMKGQMEVDANHLN